MSISSEVNRNIYLGNDSTLIYTYSYRIFREEDLQVIVLEDATNAETLLTLDTDYTVQDINSETGTITLVDLGQNYISTAGFLATGFTLSIRRRLALTQETDIRNQGQFFPEVHEDEFDKSRMIDLQQQDELDRSLKISEAIDPGTFNATIPAPVSYTHLTLPTTPYV